MTKTKRRPRRRAGRQVGGPGFVVLFSAALLCASPGWLTGQVGGQVAIQTAPDSIITLSRGSSAVLTFFESISDAAVADPEIASALSPVPNQVQVNGLAVGSTSLVVYRVVGAPRLYMIEVRADVASLQRQIDDLFPGAGLRVTSTGTSVVLSGQVRDPAIKRKAIEIVSTQGIQVVDNVDSPTPEQILLAVEIAEVSRSTMKEFGGDLLRILNPETLDHAMDQGDTHSIETLSEGFITLLIEGDGSRLDAIIKALKNTGEFRSLARPNLVTREGQEASFLAGGEFPFPTVQSSQNSNAVTIQWKEFGVRLNFLPTITNAGNVQLRVSPEVSSLDFANGLTFQGFNIPTILARRVETDVELRPGQTLAIGGMLNNIRTEDVDKIPVLGDIPILGAFFRSQAMREERTELLVLVTPHILDSDNLPAGVLPTGNPDDWEWDPHIRDWIRERPDTASGSRRSGGN